MGSSRKPKKRKKPIVAIVYDFDDTLCRGQMMDYGLLPALGIEDAAEIEAFWNKSNNRAKKQSADRICVFMQLILDLAREKGPAITQDFLRQCGAKVKLRDGLLGRNNWFERINKAHDQLDVQHYIISSGLKEIILGTKIAGSFTPNEERIFASKYLYETASSGKSRAVGIGQAVNYTTKTQFLFRINKGLLKPGSEKDINEFMPQSKRPIPFDRMIFIGDGDTDVPCFRLIKHFGGHALAVNKNEDETASELLSKLFINGRVDGVSVKDHFVKGGQLEKLMNIIFDKIEANV